VPVATALVTKVCETMDVPEDCPYVPN